MSDRYRLAPLLASNGRVMAAGARAVVAAERRLARAESELRAAEAWAGRERERVQTTRARVRPGSAPAYMLAWEGRAAAAARRGLERAEQALERARETRAERAAEVARERERLAGAVARDQALRRHQRAFMDRRRAEREAREQARADDAVHARMTSARTMLPTRR